MAELQKHNTAVRLNGSLKAPHPQPKKPRVCWYLVLMTHCDGRVVHKVGNYRGVDNRARAEELAVRGFIDPTPYDAPAGAIIKADNPLAILTDPGVDKMRQALSQAAQSTWKPGMVLPRPTQQPRLAEEMEPTEAEVDALLAVGSGDGGGEEPSDEPLPEIPLFVPGALNPNPPPPKKPAARNRG